MVKPRDILVIGAGVIGVCCARALQQDGHRVRLIDARPPGEGCSWGNAGIIANDAVTPLATPGTLARLPRMLLDRYSPLAVRASYLPRMLPWFLRFLLSARPSSVHAGSRALADLCGDAVPAWLRLVEGSKAAARLSNTGWLTVFESERALAAAAEGRTRLAELGVHRELLDATATRQRVPALSERVKGALLSPNVWKCDDPAGLVTQLARDVESSGGDIVRGRVTGIDATTGRIIVSTEDGPTLTAEHAVIAAGAHSRPLARGLGEDIPLDTERGYHAMFASPGVDVSMPVQSGDYQYVVTPMARGLRIAGTSELGGLAAPPDPGRIAIMLDRAGHLLPGLDVAGEHSTWMGFRPTLPDSLPLIGRSVRHNRVSYALGHQHLGLTLAAITGELVRDDLAGRPTAFDIERFSIRRFR